MPRNVRTARGEVVDFDTIIIKQQLANAPMNVEVKRRAQLIEAKEKVRGQKVSPPIADVVLEAVTTDPKTVTLDTPTSILSDESFEPEAPVSKLAGIEPVANIPDRTKK